MSSRTPAQAIAWAMTQTRGYGGMCLRFTRTAFGIPSKYATAYEAWTRAIKRHPTTNVTNIPRGAPIFFKSPNHNMGHIAIYLGGGKMRSSGSAKNPVIGTVAVATYLRYGYTLLGWAEDINGVPIGGLYAPNAREKSKIAAVQRALHLDDDTYFGDVLDKGLRAVRYASAFGRHKFPFGVRYTQRRVGTPADNDWGQKSNAAHDHTVATLRQIFGLPKGTRWDTALDNAYKAFKARNYKNW